MTRYADALTVAATRTRVDLDAAPPGPLPWLAGVPAELAEHAAWGPYLTARARRVSTLSVQVRRRAENSLPDWMHRYDDVLTPDLRATLALWRAGVGIKANDRTLAGAVPTDEREATFHRRLIRTINARHGEAVKVWEERIVGYVGRYDEQTLELAKHLDRLERRGIDAQQLLDLAASRQPLPVERPTAALAYRVRDTATTSHTRRGLPVDEPFRPSTRPSGGPALGL